MQTLLNFLDLFTIMHALSGRDKVISKMPIIMLGNGSNKLQQPMLLNSNIYFLGFPLATWKKKLFKGNFTGKYIFLSR